MFMTIKHIYYYFLIKSAFRNRKKQDIFAFGLLDYCENVRMKIKYFTLYSKVPFVNMN